MSDAERATNGSCWLATTPDTSRHPPLEGEARAQTAVVGGGIVGLSTALMLQRSGRSVVLLEAGRVGRGVTAGSTAKVTSQHGLIYHDLTERHGRRAADAYAKSNEAGREWIAEQVETLDVDCDLEVCSSYIYAIGERQGAAVEREVDAARAAGLPASLERGDIGLPFKVRAAARFDRQAQFHPVRYLNALAAAFSAQGGRIHEGSRVVDVQHGRPCKVLTERGSVDADDVVIATNIPILDRGGFFGRAFPFRHMCIATAPVDEDRVPAGMFISADEPTRSFRSTPWSPTRRMMVFIGESFPTGHDDPVRRLRELEGFAREHFGIVETAYRRGNQDYYAADRIPYVGAILPGMARIKVATGFNAWGITAGTAAAMILTDDVLGHRNEWAFLYDSLRLGVRGGAAMLVSKNASVAKSWLGERLHREPDGDPDSLEPGRAALLRIDGKTAAVYRDAEGQLHAFDARCTHMGCHLHWNEAEKSWDCHCHGSRFDWRGEVLGGPAVHALKPLRPS